MVRRTIISPIAEEEIQDAKKAYSTRSSERASEFLSEIRVALPAIQEFPFARAIQATTDNMEIRRIKIVRFPYYIFYLVYPSFDTNTDEALDVIYVFACRHERQGEPPWTARDPFRSI